MRIAKVNGHEYTYSLTRREWIMLVCGCHESASRCLFPKTIQRRAIWKSHPTFPTIRDKEEAAYEELLDAAIMQLEDSENEKR